MHAIDTPALQQRVPDIEPNAVDDECQDAALQAQRAVAELRTGREVEIRARGRRLVVAALELVEPSAIDLGVADGHGLALLLSPERASVLGHVATGAAVQVHLHPTDSLCTGANRAASAARRIAGLDDPAAAVQDECVLEDLHGSAACAALELARQARLQPALLVKCATTVDRDALSDGAQRVAVSAEAVLAYRSARGRLLARTGTARVPLERAKDTVVTAYRERFGDAEHAAVMIGSPDLAKPVTVRLHSSCFTGDLFGSLRCDCGEQLAGAIDRLAAEGGGVVLYLSQEGRGIGLGNKLRAYRMQAAGLDTIEADRRLGFAADGRDFSAARTILEDLGIRQVRLLTNNPAKVAALHGGGIEVVERLPLSGTVNPHNHRYLETKRDRGGHLASVTAGVYRQLATDQPIPS